jgi:hypothetical protein
MARGDWVSPWQMSFADYQGKKVTISVTFNTSTLAIVNPGLTGNREVGCVYDRVVVGRIEDGTRRVWLIPEGAFSVAPGPLGARGFDLITDITESGFTLGVSEEET